MKYMDSFIDESLQHFNSIFNYKAFELDMYETETEVVIEAKLPGYNRDQIQLEIIEDQLRIAVEDSKVVKENDMQNHPYKKQQSFQKIERLITLPFTISEADTKATYKDGIIQITTPKRKPKFIEIDE